MGRVLLIIAALFTFSAANAAETVPVRAGEHGDYSRLVIPNAPEGWRIATSDRKIEITFPGESVAFDLSDIVEKRKAHRVLAARVLDGDAARALVLSLTCDCPVRTSKGAGNSIVIDIFNDTPETAAALADDALQSPVSNEARNSGSATPESMRAARDRMIALLAEARHQGVVTLKLDEEREAEAARALEEQEAMQAATPVMQASHSGTPEHNNPKPSEPATLSEPLAEHSAPVMLAELEEPLSDNCADPELFAAPEKAGAIDYAVVSNLRHRFDLSENEEERNDIAASLAVAYIHLGFFEEASAIAAPRAKNGDDYMAAAAGLAELASGANTAAARLFSPYRACNAFFEMAYAAAAGPYAENAAEMREKHVAALRVLTPTLRAPLAERLGLNALENNDLSIARAFYEVAAEARRGEASAALAILENALGAVPEKAGLVQEQLAEIAQTPGPLQTKALSILAEQYETEADAAYEGMLDDIAAQRSKKGGSLADARASFAGAKALAAAGRLPEGVAVLAGAAESAPDARPAAQALSRSLIMNALLSEDAETRLDAVATFFIHKDLVNGHDDGDLNVAVARELALYGAMKLVADALEGAPAGWRAQADAARALAALNAGDTGAAIDIAAHGAPSKELATIAIRAYERAGDRSGAVAAVKTALRDGPGDNAYANAAWRAEDWKLTVEAFSKTPKQDRSVAAAKRAALASLNAKKRSLPSAVAEALAGDQATLEALAHMFAPAPAVNLRAIDILADYSRGVVKETVFMNTGLGAEGE